MSTTKSPMCNTITLFSPSSLSARHEDPWEVSPGRPSEEDLSRSLWRLQRQRRHPKHPSDRRWKRPAVQLRPPEHRPRGADLAGHQWHGDRRPVGGPIRVQCALQELGDRDHPAAGRREQTELRHPFHHSQRKVVWWELPSWKGLGVWVQHRLRAASWH